MIDSYEVEEYLYGSNDSNKTIVKRKLRAAPRIDFNDQEQVNWLKIQMLKHADIYLLYGQL